MSLKRKQRYMIQGRPYDKYISHIGIMHTVDDMYFLPPWLLHDTVHNLLLQTPDGFMTVNQLFAYFNALIVASNASNTPMSMEARKQLLELMWLLFWKA